MRSKQIKKYIILSPDAIGMEKYVRRYKDHHSKFIHASWLLKEDLGKTVVLPDMHGIDTTYEIYGLWDNESSRIKVLLKDVNGGPFMIEESKVISHALGYTRMRNLVTGEEHKWDYVNQSKFFQITNRTDLIEEVEDTPLTTIDDEDEGYYDEEEENYVDPLVKALQDDLTDDGDSSAL